MNKKTVMIAVLAVAVIAIAATFAAIGNGDGERMIMSHPKTLAYGYSETRIWMIVSMRTT